MGILLVIVLYLVVAIIVFGNLPFTFFQQDEWAAFGNFIYWEKAHLSWFDRLFVYGQGTHRIPLGSMVSYLQFSFFQSNFFLYGVTSILLHVVNSFLVFYLTNLFLKKKWLGFLAGSFFLTNSISHQAVTWISPTIGTAGSALFVLLSLIFFTLYVLHGERIIHLLFAASFFITSFLFKETPLFLVFFFPSMWLIYCQKKSVFKGIKIFCLFFFIVIFYFIFRIYFILSGPVEHITSEALSQPSFPVYLYRLIVLPIRFIVEGIIPIQFIIKAADKIVFLGYPKFILADGSANPFIVESLGSDIIILLIFFVILALFSLLIYYFKAARKIELIKSLVLSFLFIGLSSLPFIVIPGPAGYASLIDGRHFYLTSIFTAIFFTAITAYAYAKYSKLRIFLIGVLCIVIGFHAQKIKSDIVKQVEIGQTRKLILNTIKESYPKLPAKVIIYAESDKPYYGLPDEEKILPFQSGLGQTLLVWYNEHRENFPSCFFNDRFLYEQLSQGYRECEGRGFGYLREIENLKKTIQEYSLSPENIIAFRFSSMDNSLIDITTQLRKNLIK